MLRQLNSLVFNWGKSSVPWTNVYGLARSILALSTALALIFNDARIFFRPASGFESYPYCNSGFSLFCLVPNDYLILNITKWICIAILLLVASGWRPRITGILHWYIVYSFHSTALTLDGGEQVATVFTLLLLPITLTDPRKWHWSSYSRDTNSKKHIYSAIIAMNSYILIRVQVAILYFNSTIAKMFEEDWLNGTAVYYYANDPMLGFPDLLLNLFSPILASPAVVFITWGTLIIQLLLFMFLIAPKKYWSYMLIAALLFHEMIAVMLGLITFSLAMLAVLILYLRPLENTFFKRTKANAPQGKLKEVSINRSLAKQKKAI